MISCPKYRVQALSVLAFALLLSPGCTRSGINLKNHVVVKVNEATLSAEEFSELLASRLKMFNSLSAKDSAVIAQAKSAVVQDFIVRVVTQDWAQKKQLFVRQEQLEKEANRLRANYPDDIAFRKALADEGLGYSHWEDRLKYTLLERMVLDEVRKAIVNPTTDEAREYFNNHKNLFQQTAAVRIRQIVVDTDVNAQKIKKELATGKSMASLAKKFSITSEGPLEGDVGWIEKGTLEVFDAAFKMGVGQRSQIVKSPFGYHIFEVTAKRVAKGLSFEESQKKIESLLTAEKEQGAYSDWLEDLVLKARVFKDDDFLKQIQVQTRSTL